MDIDFSPDHCIKCCHPNQNSSCTDPDKTKLLMYSNALYLSATGNYFGCKLVERFALYAATLAVF